MNRMVMSPAAAGLLRALVARAGVARDRILLSKVQSIDWRSLTFSGERHELELRIPPPESRLIFDRMCDGLEDAEFSIPGVLVADIAVVRTDRASDGSIDVVVEALTVQSD
jgi:hypothetical protein